MLKVPWLVMAVTCIQASSRGEAGFARSRGWKIGIHCSEARGIPIGHRSVEVPEVEADAR